MIDKNIAKEYCCIKGILSKTRVILNYKIIINNIACSIPYKYRIKLCTIYEPSYIVWCDLCCKPASWLCTDTVWLQ